MKAGSSNFPALFLKICTAFVLLLPLAGCQSGYNPLLPEIHTIYDPIYATTNSFAELTSQSTLVVLGRVKPDSRVINIARDVNDISKPDLRLLGLAQVYQVDVERVIKGVPPSSPLFIIQVEGFLVKPQASIDPSPWDAKLARQGYPYTPFIEGQRYLLFLHPLEGFEQQRFFVGIRNPWRFNATDENNVFSESSVLTDIRPAPLTEIIRQIETPPTPTPTIISPLPTPPPSATAKAAP